MLGRSELLLLPAAPGPAPALNEVEPVESALEFRRNLLSLTNLASLAGLPVVVLPAAPEGALPSGVQLIGPEGCDSELLELATRLAASPHPGHAPA
jgi:amidase